MARPSGFVRTFDTEAGRVLKEVQGALNACNEALRSPDAVGEVGRGNVVIMSLMDTLERLATAVDGLVQLREQERIAWVAHVAEGARRDAMARRAGPGAFAPVLQGEPGVPLGGAAAATASEPIQRT